jgi:hypothetical protein
VEPVAAVFGLLNEVGFNQHVRHGRDDVRDVAVVVSVRRHTDRPIARARDLAAAGRLASAVKVTGGSAQQAIEAGRVGPEASGQPQSDGHTGVQARQLSRHLGFTDHVGQEPYAFAGREGGTGIDRPRRRPDG